MRGKTAVAPDHHLVHVAASMRPPQNAGENPMFLGRPCFTSSLQ